MKISKELTNYEFANAFRNTVIFSAAIFIFGVLTLIFAGRPVIGIAEIVAAAGVFIYGLISLRIRKLKFFRYMQTYAFCLEDTTKTAVKTFSGADGRLNGRRRGMLVQRRVFADGREG